MHEEFWGTHRQTDGLQIIVRLANVASDAQEGDAGKMVVVLEKIQDHLHPMGGGH